LAGQFPWAVSVDRSDWLVQMTAKSTLNSQEFKLVLAILQREQTAHMPSRRQELLFRLFNWSVFAFLGTVVVAGLATVFDVFGGPRMQDIAVVLLWISALPILSTVILFVLNLGMMRMLFRQARLRRRLQLVQSLKDTFKAKRRHDRIRNIFTLFVAFLGPVFVVVVGSFVLLILLWVGTETHYVFGVLFVLIVLALSLAFLHFMRRGKQRLEVVTNLQASLLGRREVFESDQESILDISSTDYNRIASIERAHIIDDRANSIKMGHKESLNSSYVIQKSHKMLGATSGLDLKARVRVNDQIIRLMTNPSPPGVTEDPGTEKILRLSVPETSVDILYQVDEKRHRIRVLDLRSAADSTDLNP
jgi:hypothetical protein